MALSTKVGCLLIQSPQGDDSHQGWVSFLLGVRVVTAFEAKVERAVYKCINFFNLQVLVSFPECFPPDCVAELKHDCFYSGLPKWLKTMVAYLKASTYEKTCTDYLWSAKEAEKEEAMEPSHSQTVNNTTKSKAMSFFPLWKLKGTQPGKVCTVWLAHLEEESAEKEEGTESENPNGIEGVTEDFIVYLARTVKDAQQEEKCCYHCSSPEHFICKCPLVKTSRMDSPLNQKEGMVPKKGAQTPEGDMTTQKASQDGTPKA